MHINTTLLLRCCCYTLLLFIKITEALNYTDFGLPNNNKNSCIFSFNKTVYIFDNKQSLSIKFNQPWNIEPPLITPLLLTANTYNATTAINACSITQSGKLIIYPQQQPLQVLENKNSSTWNLNNNITYLGSQIAIDTFITTSTTVSPFSIVTFNDYIIFYNGIQTFSLDTRYRTLWTFSDPIKTTKRNLISPPVLYATSRWILSFRNEDNLIYIDCFDPYSFRWLDTISSINTATNSSNTIQTIPVVSSATIEKDSLLILIVAGTQGTTTNNGSHAEAIFWKLDISTSLSNNFTLTKLIPPTIHQTDVVMFSATSDLLVNDVSMNSDGGSVVVTPLNDEMTLFYGGAKLLQFFNTTSLEFSPNPQWLDVTTANTTTNTSPQSDGGDTKNRLAIILGSVFGGLAFIIAMIIILFCYCRKRRKNPNNNNNKALLRPKSMSNGQKEKKPLQSSSKKKNWIFLLLLGNKPKREEERNSHNDEQVMVNNSRQYEESLFTLSPITPVSPLNLFPLPSDSYAPSTSLNAVDEGILVQNNNKVKESDDSSKKVFKSRFQEVFDYHSYPLTRSSNTINKQHVTTSKSLPLESTTPEIITTTNNKKEPQKIPRSTSSYV